MKWIGAILLLLATTQIGFDIAKRLNDRPKQIRQLKNALQVLEAEIVYGQSPIHDVFYRLSKQIPEPLSSFFRTLNEKLLSSQSTLYDVWNPALDHFWKKSAMKKTEKEIMDQFGKTLGQHDFHQQQKHIQLALSHLDRVLEQAEEEKYKYGRMAKSLGVLTGLFLILLLI
ncbi:stage III sporulation protein SpoIIIAB [Salinibacillus xinjiangensis]|uniref:Stage III sporulation protein SpoAB n=1 Tax=Salinibacillus xinjiangensis TaxID=1229268 RepID=A0A6G1X6I5_9BACI|nr:stage III sporulation protein SpoIIIAB [Salinibacillus xinjiangensis]MRG86557.1 stage III sporulation protein SpoAB [Salinibacillus xinjiangensis]